MALGYIQGLMDDRAPMRRMLRGGIRRLGLGSWRFRMQIGAVERPHYAYIVHEAARLAQLLGMERISVLEFGVAGGAGLLTLERVAEEVEKLFPPIGIDIWGFDTGAGLPAPSDWRDLPYQWREGFFSMDAGALTARLKRAKLVLGDVRETVGSFLKPSIAPVGAVIHDMDFHSSTAAGLEMFLGSSEYLLPRMFCYFDDTLGDGITLYNDFTGQRLAIEEFNRAHDHAKIAVPYHLRIKDGGMAWRHQIWIAHRFDHPLYGRMIASEDQQLPI
ncbi:MAG: hypothetical protein ACRED9_13245 [Caulobacteraceae bacterium]